MKTIRSVLCSLLSLLGLVLTADAVTTSTLLTPVSITATGGGPDVDVSGSVGQARFYLTSLNTAGTNPTLACKLQGSSAPTRGYDYQTVGSTDNKLRAGATTTVKLGMSFTQSGTRSIKRVALYLKKNGTITSGKIVTLAINSDSAGSPSATTLGTAGTIQTDNISTTAGWVVFTFANPVDLTDATVYHLVLTGDYTASTSNYIGWYSNTVASGGNYEDHDNSNWAAVTTTQKLMAYMDQYSFSDISGGAFTSLSTAGTASAQSIELYAPSLPVWVRLYSTIGGTSNPAWTTGAMVTTTKRQEL